jgi:hypothetical protein
VKRSAGPWARGRFEALTRIGQGADGVVYLVRDRDSGAQLALKTFQDYDPERVFRLKQEFRSCAGIRHPNLAQLYELYVTDSECFFTMEFVDGTDFVGTAASRAARAGVLDDWTGIARQLVEGTAALHAAGKLHRDIKPANVLVTADGRTVLLDFGFVVGFGGGALRSERAGDVAGTLAYMAPEIFAGDAATAASDWYSVGALLYESLSGRLPFDARPGSPHRAARPQPLEGALPVTLRDLIDALLLDDPTQRPEARDIRQVLEDIGRAAPRSIAPRVAGPRVFVGRDDELAQLQAGLDRLSRGESVVVHVRGSSGMGKSELVREFLAAATQRDDFVALNGRCRPHEAVPFRAFDGVVDSLSRYLDDLAPSAVAELVPRHRHALLRLFPVLGRVLTTPHGESGDDPHADVLEIRERGFAALRELLRRLSRRCTLALWIDDVQWADADSSLLARALLGGGDAPRALIIVTYRSEDREAAQRFTAFERSGDSSPSRIDIDVSPLSLDRARQLAERLGVVDLVDVEQAVQDSGGSPLFLGQLVHFLSAPGAHSTSARLGMTGLLQARLDWLPGDARLILETAAVASRPLAPATVLRAAGLVDAAHLRLIDLQEDRLLRLAPVANDALEIYHDRIRDAVLATLDPTSLRERHRALAHTLVEDPTPDAQALFRHFLGAEEIEPAAHWATEAAEHAERALAFAEAATLYERAESLRPPDDPRRHSMALRRAQALVNAGKGAEAAPLFRTAAQASSGLDAIDLQRRAAEQYLQTGRMDEGIASVDALLRSLGLRYPRSTAGAAIATLARLAVIAAQRPTRLRGVPAAPGRRDALRIEASRSVAKGLAMVDPFRGMYFAVRTLALALRSGDARLMARELAGVGVTLVPAGPPLAGWASRLLDHAHALAHELGDPYLIGFTSITLAQKRMVSGRWAEMLALCDAGVAILRERCTGVWWEVGIGEGAAQRALEELGDFTEVARRAEHLLQQAETVDDMYRLVYALDRVAISRIAQGRLPDAAAAVAEARQRWTPVGFQMQHLYMLRNETYCALGRGDGREAWQTVLDQWPALQRSNLLRHDLLRTDAHLLRARAALAAATDGTDRAALLQMAESDAAVLERQRRGDALGHASLVRAGVAMSRAQPDTAVNLLSSAATRFSASRMTVCRALTDWRLGAIVAGERGATLVAEARDCLVRQGVTSPETLLAAWAPGFGAI